MKKNILLQLILIVFSFGFLDAQTLTYKNSGIAIGDVLSTRIADTTNILPGQAGNNVIWDFPNLLFGTDIVTHSAVSPAITPYSASFPTANVATQNQGSYYYYKCDSSEYTVIGVADSTSVIIYSDPAVCFKYPVNYGSSLTDSFFADLGIMIIKGVQITSADGKGTINVAGKSFNNVLRIKSISHTVDSSSFFTMELNTVQYAWYDCIHKTPLLSINYMQVITSFGDTIATKSVGVSNDIVTNIDKNYTLGENTLELYPNPATKNVTIEFSIENIHKPVNLQVVDLKGKIVSQKQISNIVQGINSLNLDIDKLVGGVYMVNLLQGNVIIQKKLVVF